MFAARQLEEVVYQRREPECELLFQVVADNLETFLDRTRTDEQELPAHVEHELRRYTECGVLAHGFVRLRCDDCGKSRAVAFSCKGRGFCPSCTGRRMADTSARLVDDVFPRVPVRQWVISLPIEIRYRLAHDGELLSFVLAVFLRAVRGWYRKQARKAGHADTRCGCVTFAQRFGSALNLNPHFHTLMLDGVYAYADGDEAPLFVPAPRLTDDDVRQLVETVGARVLRLLERRGVLDLDNADPLAERSPLLAGMTAASVQGFVATGERAGRVVRRVLSDPAAAVRTSALCFASRGFSLHAATRIDANDKAGLERLCRYVARPPLAAGRLEQHSDDKLSFGLKTPWDDGTTHIVLSPLEFLEKLAALVPPPRVNLVRYHGVLAPNAKDRDKIVPADEKAVSAPASGAESDRPATRCYRLSWSALLARIFSIDACQCECGGRMKIVAAITDPASVRRYLEGVGQPADPPSIAPARASPQLDFDW